MQRIPDSSHDGFTLVETVVATGILVTALAGIAQLLALSVRSTRDAGSQSAALLAAQDKIEVLRTLAFAYDVVGAPITDPGLDSSASLSLSEDTPGFVDYLAADGALAEAGEGAALTRRWRVMPLDAFIPEALVIEVCVFLGSADNRRAASADACLATVRARQP